MNEFLSTLLQAVIIAAVPVVATFIGKGINALGQYLSSKTENETAKVYLKEAALAISTAVSHTSQTYVDALKKNNEFSEENQRAALQKSLEEAKKLLTAEAAAFLRRAYGDLDAYLIANIEAEVRTQKLIAPVA